jgi:molybdate transport system substrate-binding protein
MKLSRWIVLLLAVVLIGALPSIAQALTIAAGAGYRRPVNQLAGLFEKETGIKVERVYGNMGQVISQIKSGRVVDVFIGAQSFLKASGLKVDQTCEFGRGQLVLAYPKGSKVTSVQDLAKPEIKRVAVPDPKKAIYGRAGMQCVKNSGLLPALKDKLLVVGTVPQVSTYLVSGEVDAGFLNITDAQALGEKIGGLMKVDPKLYTPLVIMVARLTDAPKPDQAARFLEFVASPAGRKIAVAHGL